MSSSITIPIFNGQGSSPSKVAEMRHLALSDALRPLGCVFLSACHAAFHTELSTLTCIKHGVDLTDFTTKESLITVPKERYAYNAVISGSTLFLVQILRYLSLIDTATSLTPFSDMLNLNAAHGVGVLGFSSGILPATVVATSLSSAAFLHHAVETYRLALWIGVRVQEYRITTLSTCYSEPSAPWSLVFLGSEKAKVEQAIEDFSKTREASPLYVTAVIDATCVTVSGRPDTLDAFAKHFGAAVHKMSLETLYHAHVHVEGARHAILSDVCRRNIEFPSMANINIPLRSSFTGQALHKSDSGSLLELVVDMILTQPVNWDLVVRNAAQLALPAPVRVLNVGPGSGLAKSFVKDLGSAAVMFDLSVTNLVRPPKQEPIAIVGMAVNMPGAPNVSKLWEVLEQGINTISEIPDNRFKVSDYQDGKRQMKAHTGNFIDNVDEFDNKFFKISPREARSMDPQQRILLHTAYEALEDAGYVPNATASFNPDTFGCYVGVATNDYVQNLRNDIDVYYSTGTLKAFLSGRLSYAMQLSGPSIVLDTACSSSGVAVYQGARALMNGDCNAALVGGVNVISSPDMFLGLDRGHFLSPTGQCKAFDASADGYSRSEGCGLFVLKRLSDAIAEQDHIWGVIRAVDVNQSGKASSITHPHAPTQVKLFHTVLANAGVSALQVNVIEAHGTGTQAGDPGELESIRGVFLEKSGRELHVGSVKANIGHLEAASGAAGLAKLLLMLRHKTIPACISLKNMNPKIPAGHGLVIDRIATPWNPVETGKTRMALLNNFGAAGSNSAIVLEEHVPLSLDVEDIPLVLGLSAKTEEALEKLRERYLDWLQDDQCAEVWPNIAYTSTSRRQLYTYRMSVSATSKQDAVEKLQKVKVVEAAPMDPPKVTFVFSGQGAQYLGMGSSLYDSSPLFKSIVNECHDYLISGGFVGVLPIILAQEGSSGLSQIDEFEAYQSAIFVLEYALARLWMSWGVTPNSVVGHSLGEYAALVIAGVLSLQSALTIVANRVRFMVSRCAVASTGMIAVNLPASSLATHLTSFVDLTVACLNSSTDCVVSGPLVSLSAFKEYLDTSVKCKNVILSVPFGFHSAAMAPLLEDLTNIVKSVALLPPTLPIISNVHGSVVRPGDSSVFDAEYFARHCAEPVQFELGVGSLVQEQHTDIWLEIGPHTACLPMVKSILGGQPGLLLPSLKKQQNPWTTLMTTLSQLYTTGLPINWRATFGHIAGVFCVSLPSYPFSPSKFWVNFEEQSTSEAVVTTPEYPLSDYSMLHTWIQQPSLKNDFTSIFETPISKLAKSISGHQVATLPLCPASVYLEQVFAGLAISWPQSTDQHAVLRGITFVQPLVYDPEVTRIVITAITVKKDVGSFSVSSRIHGKSDSECVHARGELKLQASSITNTKFLRAFPSITRNVASITRPGQQHETFSTRIIYENLFQRVVDYSKEYHTMESITIDASQMEGSARVRLPVEHITGKHVVHPVFLDTLLHAAGFVANLQGGRNDAFICTEVGSVRVLPELVDPNAHYTVYCSNVWIENEGAILAEAWACHDQTGQIVACMKGMQFRRLRLDSFTRMLAKAAGRSPSSRPNSHTTITAPAIIERIARPSLLSTESEVANIVAETCGVNTSSVGLDTELEALGVDSLMSIEIFGRLQTAFPEARLEANILSTCKSTRDIIRELGPVSVPSSPSQSGMSTPETLVTDDETSSMSIGDDEVDIKGVLATVLDINITDIKDSTDFEHLGLDSLTSIEALHALKTELGLELPDNFFEMYSTVHAVRGYLNSSTKKPSPIIPQGITKMLRLDTFPSPIQSSPSNGSVPLFLFHDGSGLVNYYSKVAPLHRDVWGVHNPRFSTSQPWKDVVEMAQDYADRIAQMSSGPVMLGGWSFGGVAAYEAALQLSKRGIIVKGLLLIDAPNPENHVPLSTAIISAATSLDKHDNSQVGRLVQTQFAANSAMLKDYNPYSTRGTCPPVVYLRSEDGFNPVGVEGVPAWLSDRRGRESGWEKIACGRVKVFDIPGNHFQAFHSNNVAAVSAKMAEGCEYLQTLTLS